MAACCCAPGANGAGGRRGAGQEVCSCFGVDAKGRSASTCALQRATAEQRLASLQGALQCGTNCGSCLPELKRMVRPADPRRQPLA